MRKRLQALCNCIDRQYTSLADIGYDHGQVLRWALHNGFEKLIGVEQTEKFSHSYKRLFGEDGVDLRCGDGLRPLQDQEAQVLVFSGIGEQQIRRILEESPDHMQYAQQIIFSPSSIDLQLRPFLKARNWCIEREVFVCESKKPYVIASAVPGAQSVADDEIEALAPYFLIHGNAYDIDIYLRFVAKRFHYNYKDYHAKILKKIADLS
ncbi:MAG: tRNA (adenine(22)-N(1))-methyltransferase TrmK [Planctomycetes bacterium]|nr:tRNA (adenine(22)-N(1))-methyltransferase TrmK [Planctomycetota bacterium]